MSPVIVVSDSEISAGWARPLTVLLVDDSPLIGEAVRRILRGHPDLAYHYCSEGPRALETAIELAPAVILLDLVMPDVEGLDLVLRFREEERTRNVPLVVLSTQEEPQVKAEAFRRGANDYIVKLPSEVELVARVRYHAQAHLDAERGRAAHAALRESQELLRQRNEEIQRQLDTVARQARALEARNEFIRSRIGGQLLASIRREIRTLARLSHPDIIRVLDEGVDRGMPWYAMELLEGVTLRRLMLAGFQDLASGVETLSGSRQPGRGWWTHGLSTDLSAVDEGRPEAAAGGSPAARSVSVGTAVSLIRKLCSPVAYLHGEGIIHRDLKPENVVVRPDGRPSLVDFGTLSRFAAAGVRDALERSGEVVGTVHYMSPEQARGDLVDARSDLYSMGCILYELLCGEPPFRGGPAEVIKMHLERPPEPPSARVPGLPAPLDEVVLGLLAKDPHQRPRHAGSVAAALLPFDPSPGAEPAVPAPSLGRGAHFYRSSLQGRAAVLASVEAQLSETMKGRGTLVALLGESGMGKTRVAMEIGNRALRLGADVHPCICRRTSKLGEQLLPKLLEPIVDACREGGPGAARRLLGSHAAVLASLHPGIQELADTSSAPDLSHVAPADPQRIHDALREAWRAHGAERARVWIVDDVHLADELSLGFLLHLVRSGALEDRPILVLVTCRPRREGQSLARLISRAPARFELGPLRDQDLEGLASEMMALPAPRPLLTSALATRAGGSPALLAEYLRAAVDEGLLRHDARVGWTASSPEGELGLAAALPSTLSELLARRAARLTGVERRVAEACSVLGQRIDATAASHVSGLTERDVVTSLDELERRGVLEPAEGEYFRFVHPELAGLLERGLTAEARRASHRAAAAHLEGVADRDEWLGELGRHYREAGDVRNARPLLRRAAALALSRHAMDTARELLLACLEVEEAGGTEAVEARIRLGASVLLSASPEEAERELLAAATGAGRLGNDGLRAQALSALGHARQILGNVSGARSAFEEAAALDRARGDRRALAAVLTNLGTLLRETGLVNEAERCYEEALEVQEREGDPDRLGGLLGSFAALRYERGQPEAAAALFARSAALFRQTGNQRSEGLALANLAALRTEQERWEEAQRLLATALESHRAVGDLQLEASTLSNLGVLASDRRRHAEAIARGEASVRIARKLGATRLLGMGLLNLASFRYEGGEAGGVDGLCQEAVGYLREVSARRLEGVALCVWADMAQRSGDLEAARPRLDAALARLREVGDRGWEAKGLLAASVGARWRGDLAQARRLADASVRLQRENGSVVGLVQGLIALARVELAEGQDPAALAEEARWAVAGRVEGVEGRTPGRLASLERAVDASRKGLRLVRGELLQELPAGILARLAALP